jgi:hypothetical protein
MNPVVRLGAQVMRGGERIARVLDPWTGWVPIRDDLWLLAVWDGVFLMAVAGEVGSFYFRRFIGDWAFPAGFLVALPVAFTALRAAAERLPSVFLLLIGTVATATAIGLPLVMP